MRVNLSELLDRLIARLGPAFIVWMMVFTRACGLIGGVLVVYYVRLTLELTGSLRFHWNLVAATVVLVAVTATVLLALWETRRLRTVMRLLQLGRPFPRELGLQAGREAVAFPIQHHLREAWLVPLCCLPPVYLYLPLAAEASLTVLVHITIAALMGVAVAVSVAYFVIERLMHAVVRHLQSFGVEIDYEHLPNSRLFNQILFPFALTIVITALMIATLATEKANNLARFPDVNELDRVVRSLRVQTIAISACAVLMALLVSTFIAKSVSNPVQEIVRAMRRVEAGFLTERIAAVSTNEIGMLGRSFNRMVTRLEENQSVIQEMAASLERKVHERTRELEESKRQLQYSYEQLQEHDRLKTQFFSNVSHELRTPLTLMLAPVETIFDEVVGPLTADQHRLVDVVRRNCVRLLDLINDLLDFSKLEARQSTLCPVPTNLNAMIDELVSSASLLASERQIRMVLQCDSSIPNVVLDREKIEKVVTNLISNALKFTDRSGSVEVITRRDGERLLIQVTDTGIGIAPEHHDRIWERFVQIDGSASRKFPGTGLGLPLARQFVELHGGTIELRSELGKGACFTAMLPLVPAPDGAATPLFVPRGTNYSELLVRPVEGTSRPASRTPADPSSKDTILIVDDSPDVLTVLRATLSGEYNVLEARDGQTGLELATQACPDLIVTDVMMPEMDGYQFCAKVKSDPRTERIPLIMLTAKAELSMKIEGLEQGADDFMVKPFNPRELQARARSLVKLRKLERALHKRNDEMENALNELKLAQNRLVHSEKMTSLGELVAGIAHEINNSINAVYNGIQPLRRRLERLQSEVCTVLAAGSSSAAVPDKSFSSILELAQVVESGAKRAADIVTDLKKFAHPGQQRKTMFDVHEGLDIAMNLLSNKMRNRVRVERAYCTDGKILCSGTQLTQVFLNILDNAQQAIGGQGVIHVSTHRDDKLLTVRLRDSGGGIPPDIMGRIFDPFFTTKEVGVGTGLGLSISYGIVKGHGGSIDVTSPLPGDESGSEFAITLPISPPDPTPQPAAAPRRLVHA